MRFTKTLLYLLFSAMILYKSSQNVSHEMPLSLSLSLAVCVAQQSVSRVLPSYYII